MFVLSAIFKFFILSYAVASIDSASILRVIGDSLQEQIAPEVKSSSLLNETDHTVLSEDQDSSSVGNARVKRDAILSAEGNCPVRPDTLVFVDNNPTYLNFSWDEPAPATPPNQTLQEPDDATGSWWPGDGENLRAACPWISTVNKTSELRDATHDSEIYPKYTTVAKCICETCIVARKYGCRLLYRDITIYKKIGCDGEHAVFQSGPLSIPVACICQGD